jgi:hypothetical protein
MARRLDGLAGGSEAQGHRRDVKEVLEAFAELYASLVTNPYRNRFLPLRVKVLVLLKVP